MADVVLDVGPLCDLLTQYFRAEDRNSLVFQPSEYFDKDICARINKIVHENGIRNVIATSAISFVELCRKWEQIAGDELSPFQLASFLNDPPDWFSIEPVDETLIQNFMDAPSDVRLPNGEVKPIEWIDAIHIATFLNRGEAILVAADKSISALFENPL